MERSVSGRGAPWSGGQRIGLRRGRSAVRISAISFAIALSQNGWMDAGERKAGTSARA